MIELTQEYLKEILDYDPETGVFTWKERNLKYFKSTRAMNAFNKKNANRIAGSVHYEGYIVITINKKTYQSHRLAWLYVYGHLPKNEIDHINHIKHDNKISNLREATKSQNLQNQIKAQKDNKSTALLGVHFNKRNNNFNASIRKDGKLKHLGCFKTAQEAHEAYIKEKRKIHEFNML